MVCDIFAGGLVGTQLGHIMLEDDYRTVEREETLLADIGRIRDVRQGPEGYIYVAIDGGDDMTTIMKLEPVE
ncbi:MAG: PQQ-dependent sugar dehydrogenase [Gammaproteobacteria bacterium]